MTLRENPLSYVSPTHVRPTCDGEMGLVHINIYIYIYIYYETQISLIYESYACETHISLNNRSHAFGKGDIFSHLVDSRHCFSYKELGKT